MKQIRLILFVLPLAALLFLNGCSSTENPADPGNGGGGNGNGPGNFLPTDFGGAAPTHVFALIRSTTTQAGVSFDLGIGVANLQNQDKGTVSCTVGGTTYTFGKTASGGVTSYVFPDPANPASIISLPEALASVSFNATGYALGLSTVVVPGRITLTAPAANSTVSKNSALTVTWSGTNGQFTGIAIADGQGNFIFNQNLGNVNSAQFTAVQMGTLAAGTGIVYAVTYNYELANDNEAVLIGQATALNNITIQ